MPRGAELDYQTGFGNHFSSEGLRGALPSQNSPQRCPYGLYAEQFSTTAFTLPRAVNRRTWMYRIRPSVMHGSFRRIDAGGLNADVEDIVASPNQLRWDPLPMPSTATDFVDGLITFGETGNPQYQKGSAIHLYAANRSMKQRVFYDADGELLIVPQQGGLLVTTELGRLLVEPLEIVVIPRGLRFRVELLGDTARGYVCENFGAPFKLPDLGPIGSNGLADERDFRVPTAWYEDAEAEYELVAKFMGGLWAARMNHSPFDVVAWRGNSAPYKYDLRRFNAMGSISFDHPDPSIFLVLHSPSETPGADELDFVIFPPRWLAMEHTFRPPWFHRNIASEFMGLIEGAYDAKAEGFKPGGASLHNCMSGHGPDAKTVEMARRADTSKPERIQNTMAFMFETRCPIRPSRYAMETSLLQGDYLACWEDLAKHFDPLRR